MAAVENYNLADELRRLTDAVEHADPRVKREADMALAEFVFENRQDIVAALSTRPAALPQTILSGHM